MLIFDIFSPRKHNAEEKKKKKKDTTHTLIMEFFIVIWHVATQTGNFELSHLAGGCLLILDQCMAWSGGCVPVSILTWNEEKQIVSVRFLGLGEILKLIL